MVAKNVKLYVVRAGQFVKIGSTVDPIKRLSQLQVGCPYKIQLVAVFPGTRKDEKELHRIFKKDRFRGEWFVYRGAIARWVDDLGPPIHNVLEERVREQLAVMSSDRS